MPPFFVLVEFNRCQFELATPVKKLGCGHVYHPECIEVWLDVNPRCPLCRRDWRRRGRRVVNPNNGGSSRGSGGARRARGSNNHGAPSGSDEELQGLEAGVRLFLMTHSVDCYAVVTSSLLNAQ